ncbi:hypothetical protein F4780DRAFT_782220 [Xylariomycetidae sp. FL0641]|nr:hypothetical protein F4780DRAFT_782220 [Xylariomycetidae sp. FL0641]
MTSPRDPQANVYSHINGEAHDLLNRLAISELCKGWPVYRDASEWKNFRSLFCDDAYVWTTWSRRQSIDGFIQKSKDGKAKGDFILHRECGTGVDLNPLTRRAVGKMKATITQRFSIRGMQAGSSSSSSVDPAVFDVDCDCRFHFFCFQEADSHVWKIKYVKLIYDKDKVVAVDGSTVPNFSPEELAKYPAGYQYLGAAQKKLGHAIDPMLPTCQGAESSAAHELWLDIYDKMDQWLSGKDDVNLTSPGTGHVVNGKGHHRNGHSNGHSNGFGH